MIKPKDVIISAYAIPGLKGVYKFPIGGGVSGKAELIEEVVSTYFGVTVRFIQERCRERKNVTARHICMFLMRRYTNLSLKEIGWRFRQDHTTVIHSIRAINNLMETDDEIMRMVQQLELRIQSV